MTESAITLHEIKKSFGKKSVLNGVSGKIEPGKVVGLLGRNGEGKTSLLRILVGHPSCRFRERFDLQAFLRMAPLRSAPKWVMSQSDLRSTISKL